MMLGRTLMRGARIARFSTGVARGHRDAAVRVWEPIVYRISLARMAERDGRHMEGGGAVMFEGCRGPREIACVYRFLGFPVELHFDRTSFVTTASLGAIAMPPELARATRHVIGDTSAVPIITHTRADREWVFLVGPNRGRGLGQRALTSLEQHRVRVLPAGSRVWLPMSDAPTGWYWSSPPRDGALAVPSRTLVLRAVQSVLDDRQTAIGLRC